MPVLWVNEGYQRSFEREIGDYKNKLEDVEAQYDRALRITQGYSGGSVSSCNVYLKKRKAALSAAMDTADRLQRTTNSYVSSVVATDQALSQSIHKQAYQFYQAKGIGPQKDTWSARAWNSITTTAEDFLTAPVDTFQAMWDGVKAFYEEHKLAFEIAFEILTDVALLVGSVMLLAAASTNPIGIIAAIGAVWAISKALYETTTDVMALDAYLQGDIGGALRLKEESLTDLVLRTGEYLDSKYNLHFMETAMKYLVVGLEVCEFVTTMMFVGQSIKEIFNLHELKSLQIKFASKRTFRENLSYLIKGGKTGIKWLGTKALPRLGSPVNWTKFAVFSLGFSFDKTSASLGELLFSMRENGEDNLKTAKKIASGTSLLELNPITKPSYDLAEDIVAILLW